MPTLNINAPNLLLHWAGVNLAHITSSIGFAQLLDPQPPRVEVFVCDTNPCVVRDDTTLQGQHRLVGGAQPTDLGDVEIELHRNGIYIDEYLNACNLSVR